MDLPLPAYARRSQCKRGLQQGLTIHVYQRTSTNEWEANKNGKKQTGNRNQLAAMIGKNCQLICTTNNSCYLLSDKKKTNKKSGTATEDEENCQRWHPERCQTSKTPFWSLTGSLIVVTLTGKPDAPKGASPVSQDEPWHVSLRTWEWYRTWGLSTIIGIINHEFINHIEDIMSLSTIIVRI